MRRKLTRTAGVNCKRKQIIGVLQDDDHYKMTRIHSKEDKPLWNLVVEYFNSLEIGQQFTRTDLLEHTYETNVTKAMKGRMTTVDTYRAYLRKLGFLSHVGNGVYQKELNFPKGLTLTIIRSAVKDMSTWKGWFVPLHENLGLKNRS